MPFHISYRSQFTHPAPNKSPSITEFGFHNPLWRLYPNMGILTYRNGKKLACVQICFKEHALAFWLV